MTVHASSTGYSGDEETLRLKGTISALEKRLAACQRKSEQRRQALLDMLNYVIDPEDSAIEIIARAYEAMRENE